MSILVAPLEALTDSRLTDPERRVLLALFSFRDKTTNTVWPSIGKLADRANLKDKTRVSKLTRNLCEKGWLTKKKRGFTGGNAYTLLFPSILDSEAKLGGDANSNLDSDTNSNLDSAAKCKEQTKEQTIYQAIETLPESPRTPKKKNGFDFSSWPTEPSAEVLQDWIKVRKAKQAPLTQSAIRGMAKELQEAERHGYSVDRCLIVCCEAGWRGFKLEWLLNRENGAQRGNVPPPAQSPSQRRTRDVSVMEQVNDHSW